MPEIAISKSDEKDYDAENAADTLVRAQEIQGDADLMKRVGSIMDRRQTATTKAVKSIAGLRKAAKARIEEMETQDSATLDK